MQQKFNRHLNYCFSMGRKNLENIMDIVDNNLQGNVKEDMQLSFTTINGDAYTNVSIDELFAYENPAENQISVLTIKSSAAAEYTVQLQLYCGYVYYMGMATHNMALSANASSDMALGKMQKELEGEFKSMIPPYFRYSSFMAFSVLMLYVYLVMLFVCGFVFGLGAVFLSVKLIIDEYYKYAEVTWLDYFVVTDFAIVVSLAFIISIVFVIVDKFVSGKINCYITGTFQIGKAWERHKVILKRMTFVKRGFIALSVLTIAAILFLYYR